MKRAVIVHCWGGVPDSRWYPWVKAELEKLGFKVAVPAMPDTDTPTFEKWLSTLTQTIDNLGGPDQELYLIGHSLGCVTNMRYIESLPEGVQIGGLVIVAGFTSDLSETDPIEDELKSFYTKPLDYDKIKQSVKNQIVAIHSDNDPWVPGEHADIFKDKLDAKVIMKHHKGHFSEADDQRHLPATTELPDVVQAINNMTS